MSVRFLFEQKRDWWVRRANPLNLKQLFPQNGGISDKALRGYISDDFFNKTTVAAKMKVNKEFKRIRRLIFLETLSKLNLNN